jgi:hypothetical protein
MIAVRAFSKTIAVTYVGLGLFGLIFLMTSLGDVRQAVVSRLPFLLIRTSQFGDQFYLRNVGAPPTTQLGASCSSVVLAALPNLDSLYDHAKWVTCCGKPTL